MMYLTRLDIDCGWKYTSFGWSVSLRIGDWPIRGFVLSIPYNKCTYGFDLLGSSIVKIDTSFTTVLKAWRVDNTHNRKKNSCGDFSFLPFLGEQYEAITQTLQNCWDTCGNIAISPLGHRISPHEHKMASRGSDFPILVVGSHHTVRLLADIFFSTACNFVRNNSRGG